MLEKFDELKIKIDTLRQKHRDLEDAKSKALLLEDARYPHHVSTPTRTAMVEAMLLGIDVLLQRTAEDIHRAISEFAMEQIPRPDAVRVIDPKDVDLSHLGMSLVTQTTS